LWVLAGLTASTACEAGSVDDTSTSGPTDTTGGSSTSTTLSSDTTTTTTTLDTSDTGDASSSTTVDPSTTEDSTGDAHNEACVAGCIVEFGCQDTCECGKTWESEAACVQWCEANLAKAETFTEFCRDAWEGISACIGTLACDEYREFHNPQVPDYPCVDEADLLAFECKGQ
jgi:hypothetical protein